MATSATCSGVHALPAFTFCHRQHQQFHLWLTRNQNSHVFPQPQRRHTDFPMPKCLAVKNVKSAIGNTDKGATEPARVLLERLFAQTQRLEEKMNRDSILFKDNEFSINLEVLESELQAALSALRRKEEDLQEAERKILLDRAELNRTRKDLDQKEKIIAAAHAKQNQMVEDLKTTNDGLAFQARHVEDLKLLLEEQKWRVVRSQAELSIKEDELDKLRNELMKKNDKVADMRLDIESRDHLLNEAFKIIEKQEAKVKELQKEVKQKEHGLAESLNMRKVEEQRLKIAESKLEKQTIEWLSTKKELKELAEQVSKNISNVNHTTEDFKRVSTLLSDVRSELITSSKSLASSHKILEDLVQQLEKQQSELHEQRSSLMSYAKSLRDAQLEVQNERSKLDVAMAERKKIDMQLSAERAYAKQLEEELKTQKAQLKKAKIEIESLQLELQQKRLEFSHAENLLQTKESELVEAGKQILQLKSEQASVQLVLKEKDDILLGALNNLANLNSEVVELKSLLKNREYQLMQATGRLQEKEKHIIAVQSELNDTKMKFSEAATVIGRIAKLTDELVISINHENQGVSSLLNEHILVSQLDHQDRLEKQKQLETELQKTKESLRAKEMEILTAKRALTVKDEELKIVHGKLEVKEKEIEIMQGKSCKNVNDLKKFYSLAQEKNEKCIDSVIHPLGTGRTGSSRMSRDVQDEHIYKNRGEDMNLDSDSEVNPDVDDRTIQEAEREMADLLALTENLLKEAGISVTSYHL